MDMKVDGVRTRQKRSRRRTKMWRLLCRLRKPTRPRRLTASAWATAPAFVPHVDSFPLVRL